VGDSGERPSFVCRGVRRQQADYSDGTVTQIDWANPHVWFYITVKGEDGRAVRWACEMGAPHQLQGRGWLRDTMKVGDVVTVAGSLARDGSKRANARLVTTADGKTLGAASSGPATPQQ
jgi:hypothetical protein